MTGEEVDILIGALQAQMEVTEMDGGQGVLTAMGLWDDQAEDPFDGRPSILPILRRLHASLKRGRSSEDVAGG